MLLAFSRVFVWVRLACSASSGSKSSSSTSISKSWFEMTLALSSSGSSSEQLSFQIISDTIGQKLTPLERPHLELLAVARMPVLRLPISRQDTFFSELCSPSSHSP
uniref:(northern house mosquito) hypothetical protein n=1 Tax=Culex pipiens TaxID=7175 RepID=A0A8D8NSZ0_CULPI